MEMEILPAVKRIIDEKRDPEAEKKRFQAAQDARDFTTMFETIFHTAVQVCKKRGQGKYWDSDKLYEVAMDMTIYLMQRYQKNPDYKMTSHVAQCCYAYLHVVYGKLQRYDKEAKQTCSYEAACLDKTYNKSYSSLEDDIIGGLE